MSDEQGEKSFEPTEHRREEFRKQGRFAQCEGHRRRRRDARPCWASSPARARASEARSIALPPAAMATSARSVARTQTAMACGPRSPPRTHGARGRRGRARGDGRRHRAVRLPRELRRPRLQAGAARPAAQARAALLAEEGHHRRRPSACSASACRVRRPTGRLLIELPRYCRLLASDSTSAGLASSTPSSASSSWRWAALAGIALHRLRAEPVPPRSRDEDDAQGGHRGDAVRRTATRRSRAGCGAARARAWRARTRSNNVKKRERRRHEPDPHRRRPALRRRRTRRPSSSPRGTTTSRCASAPRRASTESRSSRTAPLARALDAEVPIGRPIPAAHFAAVARMLAFVYRLRGNRARRHKACVIVLRDRPMQPSGARGPQWDIDRPARHHRHRPDDGAAAARACSSTCCSRFSMALAIGVFLTALFIEEALEFSAFPAVRPHRDAAPSEPERRDDAADPAPRRRRARARRARSSRRSAASSSKATSSSASSSSSSSTVINFVVVTKGAGRVAEVAARFTLDAMPGKQMAIDADLSSGAITTDVARARSKEPRARGRLLRRHGRRKQVRPRRRHRRPAHHRHQPDRRPRPRRSRAGWTSPKAAETFSVLSVGDALARRSRRCSSRRRPASS